MQFLPALFQRCLISVQVHFSPCHQRPTNFRSSRQAAEFVANRHGAIRAELKSARYTVGLPGEYGGEVERGGGVGVAMEFDNARGAGDAMELIPDRERVVTEIIQSKHLPAFAVLPGIPKVDAFRFERQIVLPSQIDRPADAVGVQDERTGIHVAVRQTCRAAFEREEKRVGIRP